MYRFLSQGDGILSHRDIASFICLIAIACKIVMYSISMFLALPFFILDEGMLLILLGYVSGNQLAKGFTPSAKKEAREG